MTTWVIDARTLGVRPTGVGIYAYRLIRRMTERRIVLVSDVAESAEIAELKRRGCEVRVYGRRVHCSAGIFGYFRFVKRVVREVKPEVFWQPNNLQPFRVAGAGRVIVSMHDVFGLGWSWRHALWHLYYRWGFGRTLRNATEIWYNSEETRGEVRGSGFVVRGSWGVGRGSGVVVRGSGFGNRGTGIVERVVYPIAEVPERAGVTTSRRERPYFLYLGNVETRKGADLLFRAWSGVEGIELVVAGSERDVKVPTMAGVVKLGYVDETTKWALLKGCVALVVPSRAEGYGLQVAEALAFGTRVIASDLAVFREVERVVGARRDAGEDWALARPAQDKGADWEPTEATGRVVYLSGFQVGTDGERVAMLRAALADEGVAFLETNPGEHVERKRDDALVC